MTPTILRLPAVKARTGLSRSTIYHMIARGVFPAPVPIGARAVGFLSTEIENWIACRIAVRERLPRIGSGLGSAKRNPDEVQKLAMKAAEAHVTRVRR
jgi:prophage regulatory protein